MSEPKNNPMLQVSHLAKRFEGIVATDDIVLDVAAGELHAVIGPNGAGKTTLIAQLSGQLTPDSGRIHFAGNDITQLPMYRRSALGWRARSRSRPCFSISACSTTWRWRCRRKPGTRFISGAMRERSRNCASPGVRCSPGWA